MTCRATSAATRRRISIAASPATSPPPRRCAARSTFLRWRCWTVSARSASPPTLKDAGVALRLPQGADPSLPLALGGAGITLREITGLYAGLATDGFAVPLRLRPDDPRAPPAVPPAPRGGERRRGADPAVPRAARRRRRLEDRHELGRPRCLVARLRCAPRRRGVGRSARRHAAARGHRPRVGAAAARPRLRPAAPRSPSRPAARGARGGRASGFGRRAASAVSAERFGSECRRRPGAMSAPWAAAVRSRSWSTARSCPPAPPAAKPPGCRTLPASTD